MLSISPNSIHANYCPNSSTLLLLCSGDPIPSQPLVLGDRLVLCSDLPSDQSYSCLENGNSKLPKARHKQ